MKRYSVIPVVFACALGPAAGGTQNFSPSIQRGLHYTITMGGQPIGTSEVIVEAEHDGHTTLRNRTRIAIESLLFSYHYASSARETWSGGQLISAEADTVEDGVASHVAVRREADSVIVITDKGGSRGRIVYALARFFSELGRRRGDASDDDSRARVVLGRGVLERRQVRLRRSLRNRGKPFSGRALGTRCGGLIAFFGTLAAVVSLARNFSRFRWLGVAHGPEAIEAIIDRANLLAELPRGARRRLLGFASGRRRRGDLGGAQDLWRGFTADASPVVDIRRRKNSAAVMDPPQRSAVCLRSAQSLLRPSRRSSTSGRCHIASPAAFEATFIDSASSSRFEKKPETVGPSATMQAPVSVALSRMRSGFSSRA